MALRKVRDGARVVVRPIEPGDKGAILEGFARLSERSRYRRFLSPTPRLSESQLRYLTEVDHDAHEALIAFDAESGEPLGVARYVRLPGDPDEAEPAVTVVDHWHGRGLGSLLLEELTARAREAGVRRFIASVLPDNEPVVALMGQVGEELEQQVADGVLTIRAELPARGAADSLRAALRDAAARRLRQVARAGQFWG